MSEPLCTIEMDGTVTKSNDFVAVIVKEDDTHSISYNTDALTLGLAFRLLAATYAECLNNCSPEEREQIKAILEGAYPAQDPESMEVPADE